MLGYLDALIAALSVRDATEAQRLLAHPLARLLPEDVVSEAAALLAAGASGHPAPPTALCLEKHKWRGADGKNATVSIALRISPDPLSLQQGNHA